MDWKQLHSTLTFFLADVPDLSHPPVFCSQCEPQLRLGGFPRITAHTADQVVIAIITTPPSAAPGPRSYDICKLQPPVSTPASLQTPAPVVTCQLPDRPRTPRPQPPHSAPPAPALKLARRADSAPPPGAPQSPTPLPPPPRPDRRSSRRAPAFPTPTLLRRRAAVRTAGPVTHGSDARVRSPARQRQLRPPPVSAFAPGPPSGPQREPRAARRGGGAARSPHSPTSGDRPRCHYEGETLALCLPAAPLLRTTLTSRRAPRRRSPGLALRRRAQSRETQLSRRAHCACVRGPACAPACASPPPAAGAAGKRSLRAWTL